MSFCFIFFFKQKTAYEMRISDWSSDVCSSDLQDDDPLPSETVSKDAPAATPGLHLRKPVAADGPAITALIARCPPLDRNSAYCNLVQCAHFADQCIVAETGARIVGWVSGHRPPSDPGRSEEHTPEPQSLIRTSYAVFCLKKKNKI